MERKSTAMNQEDMVFVFGSNEAGAHGAGAAKYAAQTLDAVPGKGYGFGSRGLTFAIPTKDKQIQTLPLDVVRNYIYSFKFNTEAEPDLKFKITQIGCGLAGFSKWDIAPFFKNSPNNCYFDEAWRPILGDEYNYWGAYP